MNFISCLAWARKGIAKENPEKVHLTPAELEQIINETRNTSDNEEQNSDDGFDMENYDKEDTISSLGIGNYVSYSNNKADPYLTVQDSDDSDNENDIIKPNDNLLLVGHVNDDLGILEVYVYNEDEGSFYIHHAYYLSNFPICMEWLSYDQGSPQPGNMCAIGNMSPFIEVWDLDIIDCLEPAYKLGKKVKKRSGYERIGHKDAVLSLSWNKIYSHILASGSKDNTVLLWDLDEGKPSTKIEDFENTIPSLQWHPFEGATLLTGCYDKLVRVYDCRIDNSFKTWNIKSKVEKAIWDYFNPYCFLVGTKSGKVKYFDCRNDKSLWTLEAHETEISGLRLSSECPGLLVTSGNDEWIKIWDISSSETPELVDSKNVNVGEIQCIDSCPDSAFIFGIGGLNKKHRLKAMNIFKIEGVAEKFSTRKLLKAVIENDNSEETEIDKQLKGASSNECTDQTVKSKKKELNSASTSKAVDNKLKKKRIEERKGKKKHKNQKQKIV